MMKKFCANTSVRILRETLAYAGSGMTTTLLMTIFLSSLMDLFGIAVIFPYLKIVVDPTAWDAFALSLTAVFPSVQRSYGLLFMGGALIALYVSKSFLQVALIRYQHRRFSELSAKMSHGLFKKILQARLSFFVENPASEVGSMGFRIPAHAAIVYKSFLQALNELFFLLVILLIFFFFYPRLTLALILFLLVIVMSIYATVIKPIAKLGRKQSEAENSKYKLIFLIVGAIREIKIMGIADIFEKLHDLASKKYEEVASQYAFLYALPVLIIETCVLVGVIGAVSLVIISGISLEKSLPYVGLVAVAAVRVIPALAKLFSSLNTFRFYAESVAKFEILKEGLAQTDHGRVQDHISFERSIEFRSVCFGYGSNEVLKGVDFTIRAGKAYGVVGASGSGKSTLLDVIAGLQPASRGEFYCDGLRFDPFHSARLSEMVGYVSQQITLIDADISYNITFQDQPNLHRLEEALRVANLKEFIRGLPQGLATSVGESGARLSGGQRQRIGIARALYRRPTILILDEATSALDAVTEREIIDSLAQLRGSMTMIIVSHRIAAVEACDEILVMSQGKITNVGSHEELLCSSLTYQRMYKLQSMLQSESLS